MNETFNTLFMALGGLLVLGLVAIGLGYALDRLVGVVEDRLKRPKQ